MKEPGHFVVRKFSSQVRSPGVLVARAYSFDFDNCANVNVTAAVQLNVGLQYHKAKLSDQTQSEKSSSSANVVGDDAIASQASVSITDTQSSQMFTDDTREPLNDDSSQSCRVDHGGCNCAAVIKSLKSELFHLQETVKLLSSQVNVLSSTLGVTVSADTTSVPANVANAAVLTTDNTKKSYASAASDASAVRQMHRNMVSAVYLDLEEKKKRASNAVICGLKNDEAFDDKGVAAGMIWH